MVINCKKEDKQYLKITDTLNLYISDIRKYPLLDYKTERNLLKQAINGCTENIRQNAINKLVCSNQRFIYSVAKKMANNNNLMDLINEGNIGFIECIKHFDLKYKCRLITYAVWWIRKSISEYLSGSEQSVKPNTYFNIYRYVNKIKEDFLQKYERYPLLNEIKKILAAKYNLKIENLKLIEDLKMLSIDDAYYNENEPSSVNMDFNIHTSNNNVYDDLNENDAKIVTKFILDNLNDRERKIIKMLYGIGTDKVTMENISEELNLTRERVRQLHSEIIEKLKKYKNFAA